MAESGTPKESGLSSSLLIGSEVEYDFTCHPCGGVGRILEAEGYCLDCCVYLCAQCIKYHRALPALAHHQLVDKENMPKQQGPPQVKDVCTERCQLHKDKIVEYFCPTHKVLGCTVCITLKHKLCEDVAYIPEVATGLEDSHDYTEFKAKLDVMIQMSKDTVKYSQDRLKSSNDNYTKIIQEIEAYKQEIIQTLDILVDDIKTQANQGKAKNTSILNTLATEGNQVLVELEAMSKDIKEHLSKKHYSQLFIQIRKTEQKLTELEERLKEMNKTSATVCGFLKNPELKKMVERKGALGMLQERNPKETTAKHVTDINIKSDSDKKTCIITGVALLSTSTLVAVDRENETVKLIDVDNNTILSEFKPEAYPWTVTKVDYDRVAVTLPEAKKVLFLRYDKGNGLAIDKEIKVNDACWGIAYVSDKIVVSFYDPTEVRILSMNGKVLQTLAMDDRGNRLFKAIQYVAVSAYTQCIYFSDGSQNSVIMLDMNGKVKAVFKDYNLKCPRQLAVDPVGFMYLCDGHSNNIHILTVDCEKVKIVLRETDGLKCPRSVCYCETTGRLYVGMLYNNNVKVYQLV